MIDAVAAYREDGYARLGVLFSEEELVPLRERAVDLMLGRVTYDGMFFQKDTTSGVYRDLVFGKGYEGPSLEYRKIEKLEMDPLFLRVIECAAYERVVKAILGPEVSLYRAVLFNKAALGGTHLPWHQDAGNFWGLDRDPVVQIWLALDDAPIEAGCIEIVPGSHKGGLVTPLGGLVPEDRARAGRASERAVPLPAASGEAILLHNLAWHRSGTNQTPKPRRGLTVCYLDAATRCQRKKRAPRIFSRVFVR